MSQWLEELLMICDDIADYRRKLKMACAKRDDVMAQGYADGKANYAELAGYADMTRQAVQQIVNRKLLEARIEIERQRNRELEAQLHDEREAARIAKWKLNNPELAQELEAYAKALREEFEGVSRDND